MKTKKEKRPKLRKRAWVKIDFGALHPNQMLKYRVHKGRRFIYMGEIPNQPGHSLVMELQSHADLGSTGLGGAFLIFHTDELVELTDDET